MSRFLPWLILLVVLVVGSPVVAMLIDMAMGPWSATAIEQDGSVTSIVFDRNMRRPDWVALPDGASIVQASRVVNVKQGRDASLLSLSVRARMTAIRDFYRQRLTLAGFKVTDMGTGTMNARTAAWLGIADILSAVRSPSGDWLSVTIRTPEGLLQRTLVELQWRRIPAPPAQPQA